MNSLYSIIIPIHNEEKVVYKLLDGLKKYSKDGHEVIIIDDGSQDSSKYILTKYDFIKSISLEKNLGKGEAIKVGLAKASSNKIIIFDGDMELDPKDINQLMILNKKENIHCVFGSRFDFISPFKSQWDFGNYFFTWLFNFIHKSKLNDSLCCAKAFYKKDIDILKIESSKFDIDIELASKLVKKIKNITNLRIGYVRRSKSEGKKLRIYDSFSILVRILKSIKKTS